MGHIIKGGRQIGMQITNLERGRDAKLLFLSQYFLNYPFNVF